MQWYAVMILRFLEITAYKIIKAVLQWHDVFMICSHCRGIIPFGTSISENPRTSLRESLCFEEAEDSWGVARLGFVVTCASSYRLCEALISLISLPILVRLTELRARNIIQISILGPGRQRQRQTLHRDACCAEARKLGRKSQSISRCEGWCHSHDRVRMEKMNNAIDSTDNHEIRINTGLI